MSDFYWEDDGGLQADMDYEAHLQATMTEEEYTEHLREQQRQIRLFNQKGNYIITATKNGKTLYLQDQKISKGGYWTQFKANARIFTDRKKAEEIAKTFRHNNPKVVCG